MALEPIAEYNVFGEIIFVAKEMFIVYTKNKSFFCLSLYRFPALLREQFLLLGTPSSSEIFVTYTKETDIIDISIQSTQQKLSFQARTTPKETYKTRCSQDITTVKDGPSIYICGNRAFSISNAVSSMYHYDTTTMTLYTCSLDRTKVHEYSLFAIARVNPDGACFIYAKKVDVFISGKKYALPIEYTTEALVSICRHKSSADIVLSFGSIIVYGDYFKTYPPNFSPDKIWNTSTYIYLYSSHTQQLLVLNRKIEIEYEVSAENVYISKEYVFMYKKEKTVVHELATFKYAFYLTGLSITEKTIYIEKKDNFLWVFEQQYLSRKSVPLFSLQIHFYDLLLCTHNRCIPIFSSNLSLYNTAEYTLSEKHGEPLCLTSEIRDVSVAYIKTEFFFFCLTGSSILFIFRNTLINLPLSAIEHSFCWSDTAAFTGSPIFAHAEKGTVYFAKERISAEYVFSALVLLCLHKHFPGDLLFSVYGNSSEFVEGIKKTLFHLLDRDEIEMAIDLIDISKKYAFPIYEEALSGMIRLLDEKNIAKLYATVDSRDLAKFASAKALNQILLQDFSFFEGFLNACAKEKKEYLVLDIVQFFAHLDLPEIHRSILSFLLQRNMLYAAGLFLSTKASKNPSKKNVPSSSEHTKTPQDLSAIRSASTPNTSSFLLQRESEAKNHIMHTFLDVQKHILYLQNSVDPAAEIEHILKSSMDPIFIGMLAERLLFLSQEP